jgi:hypothetical protein
MKKIIQPWYFILSAVTLLSSLGCNAQTSTTAFSTTGTPGAILSSSVATMTSQVPTSSLPSTTPNTTQSSHVTYTTSVQESHLPAAGLYAIWYTNHPDVLNLPYISGGQIVLQWADIEPAEGHYDFSTLDAQLSDFAKTNLKTTIQINGDRKPSWLFQLVPHTATKLSIQVGDDPGTLMYWHPDYIKAYTDLLAAFARYLKNSPYLSCVSGMRQNFDAIGTEQINVPAANQALNQWIVPVGVTQGPTWTQTLADDYQKTVLDAFVNDFSSWVFVFIRNTISDSLISTYLPLIESGKLGWFQTGSEVEPRGNGGEDSESRYYNYCLTGETAGYAESMADAWGYHGSTQDVHWASPPQWNYWRLLNDLSAGVSLIAIYGNDLNVALTGKYAQGTTAPNYQDEFNQAFEFAAKYAGFISQPQNSPGAWIAFRHSDFNILQKNSLQQKGYANAAQTAALTQYTDDYTFLIKRLPDDTTVQTNVGPDDQRFGAWARLLPATQSMRFGLDDAFVQSLKGKSSTVQITYLDSSAGSFITTLNGQTFTTDLKGTGRWQTASYAISGTNLVKDKNGADITIQSLGADIYFHMLEITKGNN